MPHVDNQCLRITSYEGHSFIYPFFYIPFFCIGNLREMLTFGPVSSKACITYSRCNCNKLWRRLECLNIWAIEVNRQSTKQLLNNFLGRFFRKASAIFGARVENRLFIKKKRCTGWHLNKRVSLKFELNNFMKMLNTFFAVC